MIIAFSLSLLCRLQGSKEPLDPTIISQITQLTMQGVRKVSEMRRHLDSFVKSELFKGQQPPEKTRRRFLPTNRVQRKSGPRFSALDQKNLDVLVEKWKAESLRLLPRRATLQQWQ